MMVKNWILVRSRRYRRNVWRRRLLKRILSSHIRRIKSRSLYRTVARAFYLPSSNAVFDLVLVYIVWKKTPGKVRSTLKRYRIENRQRGRSYSRRALSHPMLVSNQYSRDTSMKLQFSTNESWTLCDSNRFRDLKRYRLKLLRIARRERRNFQRLLFMRRLKKSLILRQKYRLESKSPRMTWSQLAFQSLSRLTTKIRL